MVSNAHEWFIMVNNGYIGNGNNDNNNTSNAVDEGWKTGKMLEGQCFT